MIGRFQRRMENIFRFLKIVLRGTIHRQIHLGFYWANLSATFTQSKIVSPIQNAILSPDAQQN